MQLASAEGLLRDCTVIGHVASAPVKTNNLKNIQKLKQKEKHVESSLKANGAIVGWPVSLNKIFKQN